jgi:hypothetical protein
VIERTGELKRMESGFRVEARAREIDWVPLGEGVRPEVLGRRINGCVTFDEAEILSAVFAIRPHRHDAAAALAVVEEEEAADFFGFQTEHRLAPDVDGAHCEGPAALGGDEVGHGHLFVVLLERLAGLNGVFDIDLVTEALEEISNRDHVFHPTLFCRALHVLSSVVELLSQEPDSHPREEPRHMERY